jgi:hypothetical protein
VVTDSPATLPSRLRHTHRETEARACWVVLWRKVERDHYVRLQSRYHHPRTVPQAAVSGSGQRAEPCRTPALTAHRSEDCFLTQKKHKGKLVHHIKVSLILVFNYRLCEKIRLAEKRQYRCFRPHPLLAREDTHALSSVMQALVLLSSPGLVFVECSFVFLFLFCHPHTQYT